MRFFWFVIAIAIVGCARHGDTLSTDLPTELEETAIEQDVAAVENSAASLGKINGIEFDGTGVARTKAVYDGKAPVIIEAVVVAKSAVGEQAILSNCQASGFSLSIKDGQWTFYWHDGVKYKFISAPATLGKRTHLLAIVENSRMEFRVDGISQGMTRSNGHRESKLPFYVAADPKLDSQYNFDPSVTEFPFTGIIYECRISNDPADIAAAKSGNFEAKSNKAFLHYVFDTAGDRAIDKSLHKNDARIENGIWLPVVSN